MRDGEFQRRIFHRYAVLGKVAFILVAAGFGVPVAPVPSAVLACVAGVVLLNPFLLRRPAVLEVLVAKIRPWNVYGWRCVTGVVPVADGDIDVSRQCRTQYHNPSAYSAYRNYSDPYSWYCVFMTCCRQSSATAQRGVLSWPLNGSSLNRAYPTRCSAPPQIKAPTHVPLEVCHVRTRRRPSHGHGSRAHCLRDRRPACSGAAEPDHEYDSDDRGRGEDHHD